MEIVADFHIHSHYSRATSKECCPEKLDLWAQRKGVNLLGTGDFTHAGWRKELKERLIPTGDGFYELKKELREDSAFKSAKVKFVVTGEISSIYKKNGRVRKIHTLIIFPSLEDAENLSLKLEKIGNLHSDGRPIIGLDSKILLEMTLDVCSKALFIPAHIWTPHFSLFGANSGFDDIEECYEDLTKYIYSLETGLSSDPAMNWRLSKLDRFALTSNSDAHSPANIAREANVFDTDFTYDAIYNAIKNNDIRKFIETIEFYPEEGKYHYDGHRACKIQWEPSKTLEVGGICPVCGGKLTVGVLHRVELLADRKEGFRPSQARGFVKLTTLQHVIAATLGCSQSTKKVNDFYNTMINKIDQELSILRKIPLEEIKNCVGEIVAEGIKRVREGRLKISAGYDGQYGIIEIFTETERKEICGQLNFLGHFPALKKNKKEEKKQFDRTKKIEKDKEKEEQRELNKEQSKAISSDRDCVIVIAGPGTGKTFSLVNRIIYLINKVNKNPSDIIAVTFTNKAAKEMYYRLSNLLSAEVIDKITIGTFHGICFDIICKKHKKLFTIADETVSIAIVEEILKKNHLPYKPLEVLNEICKNKSCFSSIAGNTLDQDITAVFDEYQRNLELFNAFDFEDIMLKALEISKNFSEFSNKNILVDEFQDINSIQYELLKIWKGERGTLFVIGDPHQSIYGFRGSSYQFFRKLKDDFKNIEEITLKYNYRSTPEIIESAKCIITKSKDPVYVPSFEPISKEKGKKIHFVNVTDNLSVGIFIAKKINELVGGIDMVDADSRSYLRREENYSFSEICVLYRMHRQSEIIEECLRKEGIPYCVAGKEQLLSDVILRMITLIKFIVNPDNFLSLLLYLKYSKMSIEIANIYVRGEHTLSRLIEIVKKNTEQQKEAEDLIRILTLFTDTTYKKETVNVMKEIIQILGLKEKDSSLEKFIKIINQYSDFHSLVYALSLATESDIVRVESKDNARGCVTLSTLHAAKGLEFKAVFIAGVNEGFIPFVNKKWELDIEEERRLFYVGVTRASRELFLISNSRKDRQKNIINPPSRFVNDIDKKYIAFQEYNKKPEAIQLSLF